MLSFDTLNPILGVRLGTEVLTIAILHVTHLHYYAPITRFVRFSLYLKLRFGFSRSANSK